MVVYYTEKPNRNQVSNMLIINTLKHNFQAKAIKIEHSQLKENNIEINYKNN